LRTLFPTRGCLKAANMARFRPRSQLPCSAGGVWRISLITANLQGISQFRGSTSVRLPELSTPEQRLRFEFPTRQNREFSEPNRELLMTDQGRRSGEQGRVKP
jgi:hypothetical protein